MPSGASGLRSKGTWERSGSGLSQPLSEGEGNMSLQASFTCGPASRLTQAHRAC